MFSLHKTSPVSIEITKKVPPVAGIITLFLTTNWPSSCINRIIFTS